MSISKKGLDFSREALLLYIIFPKINRKSNNSKTEGRKGQSGPPEQPRGEELLADPFLILAAPEGTYCAFRAALCEKELPCRFLSHPVILSRFGHTPSSRHLEKGMATHSSILAWRIPWAEEPGGITVQGVTKTQT